MQETNIAKSRQEQEQTPQTTVGDTLTEMEESKQTEEVHPGHPRKILICFKKNNQSRFAQIFQREARNLEPIPAFRTKR